MFGALVPLDKLIDLLVSWFEYLKFFRVVHSYQRAVKLRWGKFVCIVGPGAHLTWPLGLDEVIAENVVTDTQVTPVQHLTTADNKSIAVRMLLTYNVVDVKKLLLECQDRSTAMLDSATGVIADHVIGAKWKDLRSAELLGTIRTDITARALEKYGIAVEDAQWHDLVITDTHALLGSPLAPSS